MMQNLSHTTWVYIFNENGLPGFLIKFDIIKFLSGADSSGKLDDAKKLQVIDIDVIKR